MADLESTFQRKLKHEIQEMFPECIITKNETYIQGFPDLTVYYKDKYATLECKRSANVKHQPNQDYYISKMNRMGGFSRFVCPENKDDVLTEMAEYFEGRRGKNDI